jgi:NO-binding membrane sensor protein with MHYT domain
VFALILACVAATVALYMFFKFRAQWQDSWWRRGLCAIFLATAVCGMHFLGLGGSSYYAKEGVDPNALSLAGDQATRLTIGEFPQINYADDSYLGHVRCHCPLRCRLPHL